jgi:hypothetical protein
MSSETKDMSGTQAQAESKKISDLAILRKINDKLKTVSPSDTLYDLMFREKQRIEILYGLAQPSPYPNPFSKVSRRMIIMYREANQVSAGFYDDRIQDLVQQEDAYLEVPATGSSDDAKKFVRARLESYLAEIMDGSMCPEYKQQSRMSSSFISGGCHRIAKSFAVSQAPRATFHEF